MVSRTFTSLFIITYSSTAAAGVDRPRLAVTNLEARGVDVILARTVTDTITTTLDNQKVFQVISEGEILQIIEMEQTRQQIGCEAMSECLAELAGALGLSLAVSGALTRVGKDYLLTLILTNTLEAKVMSRQRRQVSRAEDLPDETASAVGMLVRDLLEEQSGELRLTSAEEGANVLVDGSLIGVTPLNPQQLTGGPHQVQVIKQGFINWGKDIYVRKSEPVALETVLVPSQDFIDDYVAGARLWRISAWISGGLGVASAAFAIGGYAWNAERGSSLNQRISTQGCTVDATPLPAADCDALNAEGSGVRGFHGAIIGMSIAATALLGTSAALFSFGPDPDRYEAYDTGGATVSVISDGRGVFATGAWQW